MDHSVSIESATLGLMMIATILTVFTGWNRTTERITRLEERVKIIIKYVTPKRGAFDVEEEEEEAIDD